MTALGMFLGNLTGQIGDLTRLIADAIATYGNHLIIASDDVTEMNELAIGLYSTDPNNIGLIYWWNDKIIYFLEWIKSNPDWTNFSAFLKALADNGLV